MKPQAFFIAQSIYSAEVDHKKVWDDLPLAAEEASKLATDLASHGYELSRQELLKGGEKRSVEDALNDWFGHVEPNSRVILFWTGHGCSEGGRHYLVCSNSPKEGITSAYAITPDLIGELVANCRAEKILIILDTCFSGEGARQIMSVLEGILATRLSVPGQVRAFAIIASAHSLEEAQEAVFSRALRAALFDSGLPSDKRVWTDNDAFITADDLALAAQNMMPLSVTSPQCKGGGLGQRFISNPRYQANLPDVNVEERSAFEHLESAARGIEVGETGWFFTGRKRLLGELIAWLENTDHGVRIVTGPPGAGKSALIGRLATLSSENYRQEAIKAGAVAIGIDPVPPAGAIDAAIHTKGKTLDDCARALAKGLNLEIGKGASIDVEALVAEIGRLDHKMTLVIDALDEATAGQGGMIAAKLIVPLGKLPHVKILVGSRRSLDGAVIPETEDRHGRLRKAFGAEAVIDDQDDETDTHDDIVEYVRRRLQSSDKHRNEDPQIMKGAAERVADKSNGIFLYARIVSRTLQGQDRLDSALPATALDAFEQDLKVRFEGEEQRLNDLLGALAWGEGKGLTRRVWPLVANALAGRQPPYNDDDIAWILGHAGWHIIEAGEDGQTVYRLAHQSLADHYRKNIDEKETQGHITDALRQGVEGAAWLDCDRYLWRHLADHAARASRLDELIRDPGYLAVADPVRLVVALPNARSVEGRRLAGIYNRVVDRLMGLPPIDRMPYIHMAAQFEDPELAVKLYPPIPTPWRCRWANVIPSAPYRIIGKHHGAVTSIAFVEIDGTPIIVSGSEDGTIGRWNAQTGKPIGELIKGDDKFVACVALGRIDSAPVVISGGDDMTIRLWSIRTGEQICEPLKGASPICSIALDELDGAPIVASGGSDGSIHLWNVRSGTLIGEPLISETNQILSVPVRSVAFGEIDGRPILVSGEGNYRGTHWDWPAIRLWDLHTREQIGKPIRPHRGWIASVAMGEIDGLPVVVSGGGDWYVRVSNARTGQPIFEPHEGHTNPVSSVALISIDGLPVIVSGSADKEIRLWNARTGEPIWEPLRGHSDYVNSVAVGTIGGAPVIFSGSEDGTIRRWKHGAEKIAGRLSERHTDSVSSVAFGKVDGTAMVVSGSNDSTVRLWNASTGEPVGKPFEGHTNRVKSVAFSEIDGVPLIASGSWDTTIRLWNASTGQPMGESLKGHTSYVWSVVFGEIDGTPVVLSAGDDGAIRRWKVSRGLSGKLLKGVTFGRWDGPTGKMLGKPIEGNGNWVGSVAFGMVDGLPIIVSGGGGGKIECWDARTGTMTKPTSSVFPNHVNSVAFGMICDMPIIVSGSDSINVGCWNARTGEWIGRRPMSHASSVRSVTLGRINGALVIVSGSYDNTIRLWDARTQESLVVCSVGDAVNSVALSPDGEIVAGLNRGVAMFDFSGVNKF